MSALPDLTGHTFGHLTVIGPAPAKDQKRQWRCHCVCGKETIVATGALTSGNSGSCGCRGLVIEIGEKFGKLTVLRPSRVRKEGGHRLWECKCECGNEHVVSGTILRNGGKKSCGCLGGGPARPIRKGTRFGRLTVIRMTKKRKDGRVLFECRCKCGKKRVLVSGKALRAGTTKSCGCLRAEGNHKHFLRPKVQRQRYADKQETVDGDKTYTTLGGAAKFLNVSPQTILKWADKCGWLDGRGIECCPEKDGLNREVMYYLKADRDKKRRNTAASLEVIRQARSRKMVPDVPGHKYFNDAAAELGICPRYLRRKLRKICPKVKIKKVEGRSKDGYARRRSFLPNWAFIKLGGKLSSASPLDSALKKILAFIRANGQMTATEIKKEIAAAIKSPAATGLSEAALQSFAEKILGSIKANGRMTVSAIKNEIAAALKGTLAERVSTPVPKTKDLWEGSPPVYFVRIEGNKHVFMVGGKERELPASRARVIQELITAGPCGLPKDVFEGKYPGGRLTLRELKTKDSAWRSVIRTPADDGKPGYRLTAAK